MSDVPALTMNQIQQLCDAGYLQRGVEYYDGKKVANASRYGNKLFGEVQGSGSTYRVLVDFSDKIKARCSCPAARRTPFCKHSVALLVSWSKAPNSFAVATEDPGLQNDPAKKKASVRKGKRESTELISAGLQSLNQFLEDIASTGVAAMTGAKAQQALDLATNLRTYRLRRLSTALMQFAESLVNKKGEPADVDLRTYTARVTDLLFTAKAVAAISEGKLKDDRYMEELVGKTWTVKNLPEVTGLRLCELAYDREDTVDGFRVESSTFVEVTTGQLYSEKLIVPMFMRGQAGAKPSRLGHIVEVAKGRAYPGFAPIRLKLEEFREVELYSEDLEQMLAQAAADFDAMRQRWLEFRKELFAPDEFFVFTRVQGFVAGEEGLIALDSGGRALPLLPQQGPLRRIDETLSRCEPLAMFGKLGVNKGRFAFEPSSLIARMNANLTLESLSWLKT